MHTTKIHRIIVGFTLVLTMFLPNPAYANSESENFKKNGNIYSDKHQYKLAISEYTKAIELDPQYAMAYNNRGYTYYLIRQYDLAIADYNKAIEINPQLEMAYWNRGNAYNTQKNYDLAIADYTKAIELDPNAYADYYRMRAAAYQATGQNALAREDNGTAYNLQSIADNNKIRDYYQHMSGGQNMYGPMP